MSNLKNLLSWPEVKEPSELQFVTPSFYEYVTFYEGVRRPFFQIVNSKLSNCADKRVSTAFTAVKTKEIECLFENNSL